jgi:tRNA-Thr(GGU) m(6)t(6)A37 methyltransferase TsaA
VEYGETEMLFKPIGTVRNELSEPPLAFQDGDLELRLETLAKAAKGSISELILNEDVAECLDGIEEFSHIMVLYWAHQIPEEGRHLNKVHPGGRKDYPLVGIFATRSPARPNPICVTTAELVAREGNVLKVRGLDAVNGSPIIDIKPHLPLSDTPSNVKLPDWMKSLSSYFSSLRRKPAKKADAGG